MMKKAILGIFAITLLFSASPVWAKQSKEEKQQEKAMRLALKEQKKEQKKWEKEEKNRLKQEAKKRKALEKEAEKERKRVEKEEKKRAKEAEKERKRLEKEQKAQRKKLEKEAEKEQRRAEKEEKKRAKEAKEERKRLEKERKKREKESSRVKKEKKPKKKGFWRSLFGGGKKKPKISKEEKLAIKAAKKEQAFYKKEAKKVEREQRAQERKVRKVQERITRIEQNEMANEARSLRKQLLDKTKRLQKLEREKSIGFWKQVRRKEVDQDYADGMYADLYKQPAWPFASLFAEHKDLLQVATHYDYATSSFNSSGSSQDLSNLAFGEKSFKLEDVLLALRLKQKKLLDDSAGGGIGRTFNDFNKELFFYGESKELGVSFDFLRYLKGQDIAVGFQIPVAYQAHNLKLDIDLPSDENGFRTNFNEQFEFALAPKKLSYLPKSSVTGIGDVSTFLNFNINTKFCEKLIVGGKAVWATAKDADTTKLWAPELGSGFNKFSIFASALFNRQRRYFNPHAFVQATYGWQGHVKRRVPKLIVNTNLTGGERPSDDDFAHSARIQTVENATFSEWDSNVAAFADNVKSVKIYPGAQVNLRLGNMIEKFIWRRAFLDCYYNFRAKGKDWISQSSLPAESWNIAALRENSHELEHKIGCDFTYQYDYSARMKLGMNYVFDGINVPETVQATFALTYEF